MDEISKKIVERSKLIDVVGSIAKLEALNIRFVVRKKYKQVALGGILNSKDLLAIILEHDTIVKYVTKLADAMIAEDTEWFIKQQEKNAN